MANDNISWRGADISQYYKPGAMPSPSANQNTNLGINALTAGIGGGMVAGPPGFVVSALATLASGILSSMFAPKPPKSPQEVYFDRMTKFYYRLGERARTAEYVKTMFNPGYQRQDTSVADIIKKHTYPQTTYGATETNVINQDTVDALDRDLLSGRATSVVIGKGRTGQHPQGRGYLYDKYYERADNEGSRVIKEGRSITGDTTKEINRYNTETGGDK